MFCIASGLCCLNIIKNKLIMIIPNRNFMKFLFFIGAQHDFHPNVRNFRLVLHMVTTKLLGPVLHESGAANSHGHSVYSLFAGREWKTGWNHDNHMKRLVII
jgi:hypothetical protein